MRDTDDQPTVPPDPPLDVQARFLIERARANFRRWEERPDKTYLLGGILDDIMRTVEILTGGEIEG